MMPRRSIHGPMRWLRRARRFARRTDGSLSMEAVVVFPLLVWAMMAGYVFFDAQRMKSLNTKAAYTVADALSREDTVNQTFVTRMGELAWLLTGGRAETSLRVSVIRFDGTDYVLSWSRETGTHFSPLGQTDVDAMTGALPRAAALDSLILVETHMPFVPIHDVGLAQMDMERRVITRPRFSPGLCWQGTTAC